MRSRYVWFLVFAAALGGLIAWLVSNYPSALDGPDDKASLIYYVLWGLLLGSAIVGVLGVNRRGLRATLAFAAKSGLAWVVIAAVLILGYSYRYELGNIKNRILGELAPASPMDGADGARVVAQPGRIAVRAGPNGHFFIDAEVNGEPVRFLVDTGASDIVPCVWFPDFDTTLSSPTNRYTSFGSCRCSRKNHQNTNDHGITVWKKRCTVR